MCYGLFPTSMVTVSKLCFLLLFSTDHFLNRHDLNSPLDFCSSESVQILALVWNVWRKKKKKGIKKNPQKTEKNGKRKLVKVSCWCFCPEALFSMACTQNLHSSSVLPSRPLCICWACSTAVPTPALKTRALHKGWQPVLHPLLHS